MRGHPQLAQELLSVQVEVHWRIDNSRRIWLRLVRRNPSQVAFWQIDHFRSLATNFAKFDTIKCTALQEEALYLYRAIDVDLVRFKA